jgi:hypothetical protein
MRLRWGAGGFKAGMNRSVSLQLQPGQQVPMSGSGIVEDLVAWFSCFGRIG